MHDNVKECVARLYKIICDHYEKIFKDTFSEDVEHCVRFILSRNIVCGNALDMKNFKGEPIRFSEWKNPSNGWINRKEYAFEDLMPLEDSIDNIKFNQTALDSTGKTHNNIMSKRIKNRLKITIQIRLLAFLICQADRHITDEKNKKFG